MTYSKLKAIPCSFFARDLYRDIRARWEGIGFSYLMLLMALMAVPAVIAIIVALHLFFFRPDVDNRSIGEHYATIIAEQVPPMTWEQGELRVDAPQPHVISITDEESTKPIIIIDTAADMAALRESDAYMLLTRDAIHTRNSDGTIETRYWSEIKQEQFYMDSQLAVQWIGDAKQWAEENRFGLYLVIFVSLWTTLVLFLTLYRIFQALIYGGVAMVICSVMKVQMAYQTAVRLACVAMTPAILADGIFVALSLGGLSALMSIAVTTGYLVFAVRSTRDMTPRVG